MLTIATKNDGHHKQQTFCSQSVCVGSASNQEAHYLVEGDSLSGANFLIELNQETGEVKLSNSGRSIALSSGPRLHQGRIVQLPLPLSFCIGRTQFQIFEAETPQSVDRGLVVLSTFAEVATGDQPERNNASPGPETLAAWLETLSELQQAAAGSRELFDLAAQAVFNPGGLDGGLILRPDKNGWRVESSFIPYPDHGIAFRNALVKQAVESRQTVYHDSQIVDTIDVENDLHCAVVCPVFDADDDVVGIVYGFRSLHRRNNRQGIRLLESQFVQVVADSLSAGMIRLESEANATRSQVLLEQVFSPQVANQLRSNPKILEGKDTEVSVLFCDMRGFSGIAERIGTHDTYELLTDVMDRFGAIITDLEGVIIDFYGDGVSAFWNAPIEQPEHATFACQAGMEILASLPELNQRWANRLGEELRVGIGVNTGISRVGNSGSRRRLKYGPRGSVVNIASRLENMTKDVGIPLLVSRETAEAVVGAFVAQRIGRVDLKGIQKASDVFQIFEKDKAPPNGCFRKYEEALALVENGDKKEAVEALNELDRLYPNIQAVQFLMKIANQSLSSTEDDRAFKSRPEIKTEEVQK